ncbi:MAG: rhodanese-like domain-containing protein [Pseudomonadota bacterium]
MQLRDPFRPNRRGSLLAWLWLAMAMAVVPTTPAAEVHEDPAVLRLQALKAEIREDYPRVTHRSIDSLLAAPAAPLLVDVRSAAEYAVSHLPGARHLDDRDALLALARANPDRTLLLYCSVGVRSSKAARWLKGQGVSNVANLAGSIFEWHNRGLPLENAEGPTMQVHGYNRFWRSRYLRKPAARAATGEVNR